MELDALLSLAELHVCRILSLRACSFALAGGTTDGGTRLFFVHEWSVTSGDSLDFLFICYSTILSEDFLWGAADAHAGDDNGFQN
jgi:hypothetical protein